MAHSCVASSSTISIVNSGFCSSSATRSRSQPHALFLSFAPLQSRKLSLKRTDEARQFGPMKAVYSGEVLASDKSYRQGVWSIRDDLETPYSPLMGMDVQGRGPPPEVQEGLGSVISQLFQQRIVRLGGEVRDDMANLIVAQLLLLDALDPDKDIVMYVNSPGGSVTAGMAIYDTMRHIRADVTTVCVGLAASMGAFLLSAGTKGKRFSFPSSRIMIHQPLGGAQGRETEIDVQVNEMMHHKANLTAHLARNCGQSIQKVYEDTDRDNFMSPKQAKEYGLIDGIIMNPQKTFYKHPLPTPIQ